MNEPVCIGADETKKLIDRHLETPEGKTKVERNREAYENFKRNMELGLRYYGKQDRSAAKRIIATVDDEGRFQLNGLTPGNRTLEVLLKFPKVPGQWYDFADVWRKKTEITVPELQNVRKDEPLEIPAIPFEFDKSERKGRQE